MPAQPPTTTPSQGAAPERQPAAAQGAAPSEWVVGIADEAPSLDPGLSATIASATTAQLHIFDALVSFVGQNLRLQSKLAESWKMIDEQTWEFELRRGVKFHNGDDFTAGTSCTRSTSTGRALAEEGLHRARSPDVEQVDPYTVRIRTRAPNPTLFTNLAALPIMPREAREKVGEEAFARQPVGTGPYRFVEFARGQRLVLEANPTYWRGPPSAGEAHAAADHRPGDARRRAEDRRRPDHRRPAGRPAQGAAGGRHRAAARSRARG